MFSKRSLATAAPAAAPALSPREAAGALLGNPLISAGGCAVAFMVVLVGFIALTGDPKAGAPSVKIALGRALAGAAMPQGWREALAPEPDAAPDLSAETVQLSTDLGAQPGGGTAVITLPSGGHVDVNQALIPAPVQALTAPGPGGGLLPVIAPDGRSPASIYARPFSPDGRPKVALVVGGLGLDAAATAKAISQLPPDVTLSFSPIADGLQSWIDQARAAGHEVLLEVPMQPADFPDSDAGPYALGSNDAAADLTTKLEWTLSRATGYFGISNYQGSGFLAATGPTATLAGNLKKRGLAFVDDGQAVARAAQLPGVARGVTQMVIDDDLSAGSISAKLSSLEAMAQKSGAAMGSGFAYGLTIDQAIAWSGGLSARGFQLAPASALMRR